MGKLSTAYAKRLMEGMDLSHMSEEEKQNLEQEIAYNSRILDTGEMGGKPERLDMKNELNQKRVPSDPDRDTSGDSVYKPEIPLSPDTINTPVDMRDPDGPDSPATINGFQTVQVMPLSQYDSEKDLLIINVAVGKLRPDRANEQVKMFKDEMDPWLKDLGWKHVMYVPVNFDHPMHRQFRTVNIQRDAASCIRNLGDLPGAISDEE